MKLEAQTLAKIKNRINEKVMKSCGTWIDWQYLLDAAALLAKCRYTLQYTYPYAYYMEPSNRKKLVSDRLRFVYNLLIFILFPIPKIRLYIISSLFNFSLNASKPN